MMADTFNNAEPHHPSRTTPSFRALQEVSSGISAEISTGNQSRSGLQD